MSEETSDIRSDLAAAFEAQEAPVAAPEAPAAPEPAEVISQAPEASAEPVEASQETQEAKAERERDEKGRFAKAKDPAKPDAVKADAKIAPEQAQPATPPPEPEVKAPVQEVRAPQSWKPAIREKFATLPPEVQQEVIRREREIGTALQETAEARQGYQKFREVLAPYEHVLRAEGADPMQVVGNLLQSAAVLSTGAPGAKAQFVANLVKHYGVDIGALDAALSGQAPPPGQAQPAVDPNYVIQQAKQALRQELEQVRMASVQKKVQSELQQLQGEEFFEDVRQDMADIIEAARRRGIDLSARDAYNRAIWANPETAAVMQQRQAARVAANPQGSTQRAKAAASSVRGTPAAPSNGAQPEDLRGQLEAAWERLQATR